LTSPARGSTTRGMESPPERPPGHVAVVFVHGMGEQRRYADSAQLATRLAWHAGAAAPRVGLTWDDGEGPADRRPRAKAVLTAALEGRDVVFHDIYWAPLVAGRTTFRSLVRWLRGRSFRPLGSLLARWASQPELKISTLQEDKDALSAVETALLDDYLAFAELARSRAGALKEGHFGAFLTFLEARQAQAGGAGGMGLSTAKEKAARHWLGRFRWVLWLTMLRSLPLLLALGAAILAMPLIAAWLVAHAVHPPRDPLAIARTLGVLALWLGAFPFARLLVQTLGDVEVYATYTEASERHAAHEAVVAQAVSVLRRALTDPACARVVLVGHSLGSVVAWDGLRALALECASGGPLTPLALARLDRVVTYGSPIDKIRFFHFMDDKNDPTFAKVLEVLRVDTRFGVFGARPDGLAWDNYYDPADLVAGRLESPNDRTMTAPVRNVAVANRAFPDPFTSHMAYIDNPKVLDGILDAIAGAPRPAPSSPRALRPRAWATAAELLVPTALLCYFLVHSLLPLVLRAGQGDPLGYLALILLLATLFVFA